MSKRIATADLLVQVGTAIDRSYTLQGHFDRNHGLCEDDADTAAKVMTLLGYGVSDDALVKAKSLIVLVKPNYDDEVASERTING
jgi:hypothetical protein